MECAGAFVRVGPDHALCGLKPGIIDLCRQPGSALVLASREDFSALPAHDGLLRSNR
jgi:hypothetical protein